ncbi:hypothetical protein SAMN05444161_4769 [Rhizobiales bacterium GAS191]|nr:hypothetical protein SAMN05444161_4769 [Rhizobiales bacterium GAS191]SEE46962.1 hypothetical protein SAMN05519104_6213 [Rhizobiales bacterium GAS188]
MRRMRFQRAWIERLREWRLAVSTLAIYGLVLQALLGGAAMSASLAVSADGGTIICKGEAWHADVPGGAPQEHGQNCACQGLCAQHGGVGLDPSSSAAAQLPSRHASRLAGPPAIVIKVPRTLRRSGFARAPPRPGVDFA